MPPPLRSQYSFLSQALTLKTSSTSSIRPLHGLRLERGRLHGRRARQLALQTDKVYERRIFGTN
jgi:hypothetical protein